MERNEGQKARTSLLDLSPSAAAAATVAGMERRLSLCPPFAGRRECLAGILGRAAVVLVPQRAVVGLGSIAKRRRRRRFADRIGERSRAHFFFHF